MSRRYKDSQVKTTRSIIAANLVRLGLIDSQTNAAKLLSASQSAVGNYLHNKRKWAKLLMSPEIEELSKEFAMGINNEETIINKIREILIL